jgi:type IV secretory pathway VirJ component
MNLWKTITILVTSLSFSHAAGWKNMPLIPFAPDSNHLPVLFIHYSGDAGFNVTDNGIAEQLLKKNIPTVGINSLSYFFNERTPKSASEDLADLISHYSKEWKTRYCIVSGYSFGADVVSFIVSSLPDSVKPMVKLVICTSPGLYADFSFHLTSWFGKSSTKNYPVISEIISLNRSIPVICFYGSDDNTSSGPALANAFIETHMLDNGHRVGSNFQDIVSLVESYCKSLNTK